MPLYLDKKIVANSSNAAAQRNQILSMRDAFAANEAAYAERFGVQYNAAARLPQDAYRDFDRTIKRIMAGDEGSNIVNLLPVRSLPIGKIVAEYAKASDSGSAQATISGRQAHKLDNAAYTYDGALVLIHDDAFGRQWREVEAMRSEDFDALVDDQANSVRAVARSINNHVINGVANVEYKGANAFGMKNSPNTQAFNLGAAGQNVDLTSDAITYADTEKVFLAALKVLQGSANNVDYPITFAVSADIWFNLLKTKTTDTNFTSALAALKALPGVADIIKTNGSQLSGNQFLAWANSDQYIQIQSGMAVNTQPVIRQMFNDPFNFVTWGAAGLLIKADSAGRSGVLYARSIS